MRKSWSKISAFILVMLMITSCSIKKHIPDGNIVITKNQIVIEPSDVDFSKSEISEFIEQQPDKTIFGFMPRLWIYYATDDKTDKRLWKWVNKNMGKEPVYYKSTSTSKSAQQIEKYLNDIGYFKSKVTTSHTDNDKLTKVTYNIKPSKPYHIQDISYEIPDTAIAHYVEKIKESLPVKTGELYNAYTLDDERNKITDYLRNNGYYYFTKEYIFYEIDSTNHQHNVEIKLRIDNITDPETGLSVPHKQFLINDIFIYPKYNIQAGKSQDNDTVSHSFSLGKRRNNYNFFFIYSNKPRIHLKTFNQVVQIHSGEKYSLRKVSQTYKALNNLKIYNINNIDFEVVDSGNDSINLLNCDITLQRGKLNYYNLQLEGTNSGGDLGILGRFTYRNHNIFRGAEVLNFKVRAGTQAQTIINNTGTNDIFNTKELGIEASIFFPRFLSPIGLQNFIMEYQPRTNITTGYNMQIRSYYSRYIINASFGYDWMRSQNIQHILTPINLNSVKVDPTSSFKALLDQETNQRIKDQYTNHLIFGLNYSFIFNNQNLRSRKDFFYFRADFQSSGNLLSLFNNTSLIEKVNDYHEIFGIRYAQYLRFSFDFRFYHYIKSDVQLAFRQMIGFGLPYGNSYDMPFEKSFYAGGTNGMRGWQFRELGPGAFSNPQHLNIERIGDIQLEFNAEFRFPIYGLIKGALFSDVGNIWTSKNSKTFTDGEFKFDTFYKQLAVDAGFGIRLDFSFFLFRIDWAAPLRNPEYPENERWRINKLQFSDIVWNFGIGYPF